MKLKLFEELKKWIKGGYNKKTAAAPEKLTFANEIGLVIGVDPARAGTVDQTSRMEVNFHPEPKIVACAPVPVLKFENFPEAKKHFGNFKCDGSCNPVPGSTVCLHVFEFKCPACREALEFNIEEMELLAMLAAESSVCPGCWERSAEFKRMAA